MAELATRPDEAIAALVSPQGRRDPYPHYEAIRAHGNLVRVDDGMLVAVGYDECVAALREPLLKVQDENSHDVIHPGWREHSSLRGFTESMLYTNPPDHSRMRRQVVGTFTARRVQELRPAVVRLVDRLLGRMADLGGGAPVDFMAEFAFRLPVAVIGELLGVPESDQVWFRAVSAEVTLALEGITDLSRLDRADAAMDELSDYFADVIERRRRRPGTDLISALVRAHDDGADGDRLSRDELIGNLVLLLVAGFDTTTHLLGHGLHTAFEHPGFAARLRAEPGFAPGFVEETLRCEPPVQATSRWAAEDVDLMGTPVPAGTKVLVLLAAANRDPRRYPDPHRCDPDRPDNRPLSFGGGIHLCVGAALARMEAQVALPALLRRFPGLAPAGPAVYRDRWLVRGHSRLPVALG
ncbi:cytochrome P450 [Actinomadura sp. NPDC047616]|uniref:cytochrome P450 n=1 Tax=Actinomadura sp. NPDC047616 TaxID=3155914 RepID=UPI0033C5B89E